MLQYYLKLPKRYNKSSCSRGDVVSQLNYKDTRMAILASEEMTVPMREITFKTWYS